MPNPLSYASLHLHMKSNVYLDLWNGWSDAGPPRGWNELWLVAGGGAYLTVGDKKYRLKKGDFCLLPDVLSKEHGCDQAEGFDVWVIQFEGTLMADSVFEHLRCAEWVVSLTPEDFEQIEAVFRRSFESSRSGELFAKILRCNRDLYILLEAFLSRAELMELPKNDWLNDTLYYISNHTDALLSIATLAARVAMHPKHFARQFRQKAGMSPGRYVAHVRLEKACYLLRLHIPLQEIADAVGMSSLQQFFRFFKKQTGMTPREYQRNQKKGGNSCK